MTDIQFILECPFDKPLKAKEKAKLISDVLACLKLGGITDARIENSYYVDRRSLAEPFVIALQVLAAVADIATIAMAIRNLLREQKSEKEIQLETGTIKLTIKGKMSNEDIVRLVRESGKIAEKEKR